MFKAIKICLRPHQYYEGSRGSRPSVIYVDEPVHVDARDETRYSRKSFLVLAAVLIILGIITIISQVLYLDLRIKRFYFKVNIFFCIEEILNDHHFTGIMTNISVDFLGPEP